MKNYFNSWARRVLACVVCGVMAVGFVWAERVSEEDAALVANHFMNVTPSSAHGQKAPAKRMVLKKAAAVEENQFYIYENADGEGWVMVAANDVVRPILAYSETGHFRTDNMPRNVKGWLGKYNRQIKQAEENGIEATAEVTQEWKQLRNGVSIKKATPVVAPLIQTKWDQDDPYWNLCPMKGSTHDCYTGCVATAMAQVMYYWKWPKQGIGSYSYTTQTLGLSCTADFANTTYDWDNMLLKYNGYYPEGSSTWTTSGVPTPTTAQKNAIATLMYHCGVAVAMDYNVASAGGSGAYTIRPNASQTTAKCAQNALVQNFGYKSTIKGYYRPGGYGYSAVSDANWHNYLKTELDAARPIMYAGADDEGGHSFICDGYDNTTPTRKYHFNWGWSGYCDGYYDIDNLAPGIGGAGSGNGSYNDAQDIIIGIEPPVTGHTVVTNGTGCTITPSANFAENDKAFTATITPTDATYDFTSISVKLGTTTLTETTHYTLSNDKQTLTIKASAITGDNSNDLTITAVWTKNRYKYELLGENCDPEMDEGTVAMNGVALNLTILPVSGYTLNNADCWDVTMGENTLTFGTGFTYNASNGAFTIAEVTGDVIIFVYGGKAVNWMSNGTLFATTMTSSDKYVLPTGTPEIECEGRVFVGWCADANYESETTAPTFVKNGDAVSEATTFYAVFAEEHAGSGTPIVQKATSIALGDKVVLVCEDASKEMTSIDSYGVGTAYSETPAGTYQFDVVAGSSSGKYAFKNGDSYIAWSSGNSLSLSEDLNSSSSWTVSISNNGQADISNAKTSSRVILWNAGSPRFAAYEDKSIGSQYYAIQLYKVTGGASTYSDYTTSCTVPTEVTVTFNANGGTGEMSAQVIPYNEATALSACTFTREGYSFAGWATSATGEVIYADKANVTLTKNTTLFAKWNINNYTISLAEVSHGTLSTSPAGNANYGATVTVTATPAENYTLGSISVVDANAQAVALSGNTFTMPASNVTVSATFNEKPTYTIRFFNNGAQVGESQTIHEDGTPIVPSDPAKPCDDYTFVGWYTAALAEDNTDEPTCVTNFTVTKDQDYYAVFSMTEEGDELSNDYKKITTLDELTNGNYVVVGNGGYALKNAVYNQYYLGVVSVSVSGTTVSNPTANIIWQITRSGNSISFYNTSVNRYACLYEVSTHHNLRMQDDANWFTPTVSNGNWSFESNDCSGWYMVHFIYNSNHEFAAKQSATTTIQLYKQSPTSIIYYTTAPTCVECTAAVTVNKGTAANGSFNIDKVGEQSTCSGKLIVTVSDIVPASGYRFQAITQTGIEGAVIDQNAKTVTYAKKTNGESTINVVFEEKPKYTIAFFDNGTQIGESQEVYEGEQPEVPANPEPACSAYTFEGWYTAELVPNNTEKPTYVTDFTATQDQNYYAIFKKVETIEVAEQDYPYTFTSQSWADATNSWTSDGSGNQLSTGQGVQVTTGTSEAGATLNSSIENVSKVVINYCTNASKGEGSIKVTVGTEESTKSVTSTGGTTLRDLVFDFDKVSGVVTFEVTCTTNSIYVNAVTITAGGSVTTTFYTSSVLAINCNWPTDVEEVETTQPAAIKALMNGQIVIIRGEAVYSITGVRVQ